LSQRTKEDVAIWKFNNGVRVRLLEKLGQYLVLLGPWGLFLIALLDSAAVPMVGGPDAVILLLSWRSPSHLAAIVSAAVIGSTIGCIVLYRIGRAGGRLVLERIDPKKRERVLRMIERNTSWAIFMSVAMPPPFPTKPVILSAGVFRAPLPTFVLAVFTGRLLRFSALAWLGARFGDRAAQLIRARYPLILGLLLGIVVIILLIRNVRRNRRRG
jgi:membrane protein YqaA with SNARE-associated domain